MEGKDWEHYRPAPTDAGRVMILHGYEVDRSRIPSYFCQENTDPIQFYWRWKVLGWPYSGGWAEQPGGLVDIILLLEEENGKRLKANAH